MTVQTLWLFSICNSIRYQCFRFVQSSFCTTFFSVDCCAACSYREFSVVGYVHCIVSNTFFWFYSLSLSRS